MLLIMFLLFISVPIFAIFYAWCGAGGDYKHPKTYNDKKGYFK